MYCQKCGTEKPNGAAFCSGCGYKFEGQVSNDSKESKSKKVKKPVNKPLIGILSVILSVCLIAGIGFAVYLNSETYKTSKAQSLIIEGEYHKALDVLETVNTDKAESMRDFVDLELSINKFLENYSGGLVDDSNATGEETLNNIDEILSCIDKLQKGSKYSWLPEKLADKYDFYYAMKNYRNDNLFEYEATFCDVQQVFENPVTRNQATEDSYHRFTLEELQENVDVSQSALDKINATYIDRTWPDIGTLSGDFLSHEGSANIKTLLNTFLNKVTEEIATQNQNIAESKQRFDMYDDLYLTNADPEYTYHICDGLQDISYKGREEIDNGDIIHDTIIVKFYQYCLENYDTIQE